MATTLRNPCCSASSRKRQMDCLFREREGIIAKIAKSEQAAETRHQADQVVVEAFILRDAAEIIAESHGDHESAPADRRDARRALGGRRITPTLDPGPAPAFVEFRHRQNDVARLRLEARACSLDAPLFFFVKGMTITWRQTLRVRRERSALTCKSSGNCEDTNSAMRSAAHIQGNRQHTMAASPAGGFPARTPLPPPQRATPTE